MYSGLYMFFSFFLLFIFLLISIVLMGMYYKKYQKLYNKEFEFLNALSHNLGGMFYLWKAVNNTEYYSSAFLKTLCLDSCDSVLEFSNFFDKSEKLLKLIDLIKCSNQDSFSIQVYCKNINKYFICEGYNIKNLNKLLGIHVRLVDSSKEMLQIKDLEFKSAGMMNLIDILEILPIHVWYRNNVGNLLYANDKARFLFNNKDIEFQQYFCNFSEKDIILSKKIKLKIDNNEKKFSIIETRDVNKKGLFIGAGYEVDDIDQRCTDYEYSTVKKMIQLFSTYPTVLYNKSCNLVFYNSAFLKAFNLSQVFVSKSPSYSEILNEILKSSSSEEDNKIKDAHIQNVLLSSNKQYIELLTLSCGKKINVIVLPIVNNSIVVEYKLL